LKRGSWKIGTRNSPGFPPNFNPPKLMSRGLPGPWVKHEWTRKAREGLKEHRNNRILKEPPRNKNLIQGASFTPCESERAPSPSGEPTGSPEPPLASSRDGSASPNPSPQPQGRALPVGVQPPPPKSPPRGPIGRFRPPTSFLRRKYCYNVFLTFPNLQQTCPRIITPLRFELWISSLDTLDRNI